MKTVVILNPAAGRGKAGARRAEIEAELKRAELEYEIVTTHARGGATELAFQAIGRGAERLAVVGGDGTLNEVVNGIIDSRRGAAVGLAIIPIGTGSDFVKALPGMRPNDVRGAVRRLAGAQTRTIDAGRVVVEAGRQRLTRSFINGLGMGLDAAVAVESLKIKRLRGLAVYLVAVIKGLATYHPGPMTVRYGDQTLSRPLFFASVGNGRCQGGGFWMTPAAELDDGELDLCVVDTMSIPAALSKIPRLMRGSHTRLPEVTMGRARRIEVSCTTPIPVATDGEVVATDARRVVVEVLPGAISLLV